MTIVYSRMTTPDGQPARNIQVEAVIRAPSTWLADRSGRVVAQANTTTDDEGRWELDLTPCTSLEHCDHAYYVITEAGRSVHYAEVRDQPPRVKLRDIIIDEPPPWDQHPVISTLGSLHNVEPAVDSSPAGYVLVSADGHKWTVVPNLLAALGDIDDSITEAEPGDTLVLLANRKWGVPNKTPALAWRTDRGQSDQHVKLTITNRNPAKTIVATWGDNTPQETITADVVEHQYPTTAEPVTYTLTVSYSDGTESSDDYPTIPWKAA